MEAAVATVMKLQQKFASDYQNEEFRAEMEEFQKVYEKLESRQKAFYKESRSASFVWLFSARKGAEGIRVSRPD